MTKMADSVQIEPAPSLAMTAKQVHQALSLSISTVYFYAETGILPARRVGKHWLFPRKSIEALATAPSKGARG